MLKRIQVPFLCFAAFVVLDWTATAQDKPSATLNSVEVQQLVKRGEPGDHARLSAHFSALAEGYTAEAKRHTSMSQSFVGNPSRNLATGMSVHCKRLAELNTQSATTLKELATHYDKLAAGVSSSQPANAERFEAGGGAKEPTDAELNSLAARASTPAEHRALQEYFLTLAKRYTAAATSHSNFAASYVGTRIAHVATVHQRLAALARDSAKEATAAAEVHKQLAGVAR